jgi:hypothetical protein
MKMVKMKKEKEDCPHHIDGKCYNDCNGLQCLPDICDTFKKMVLKYCTITSNTSDFNFAESGFTTLFHAIRNRFFKDMKERLGVEIDIMVIRYNEIEKERKVFKEIEKPIRLIPGNVDHININLKLNKED